MDWARTKFNINGLLHALVDATLGHNLLRKTTNLHRNPVKFYLQSEAGIVWLYRLFFMAGGVYVL